MDKVKEKAPLMTVFGYKPDIHHGEYGQFIRKTSQSYYSRIMDSLLFIFMNLFAPLGTEGFVMPGSFPGVILTRPDISRRNHLDFKSAELKVNYKQNKNKNQNKNKPKFRKGAANFGPQRKISDNEISDTDETANFRKTAKSFTEFYKNQEIEEKKWGGYYSNQNFVKSSDEFITFSDKDEL